MNAIKSIISACLFAVPLISSAGPGSVGNVTIALTVSHTAAGTFERDPDTGKVINPKEPTYENSWAFSKYKNDSPISDEDGEEFVSKTVVGKFGNKELLTALVEERVLGDEVTSIQGWSIVEVTPMEDNSSFYATHKTLGLVINIDEFIYYNVTDDRGWTTAKTYKRSSKTTYKNGEALEPVESESSTWKSKGTYTYFIYPFGGGTGGGGDDGGGDGGDGDGGVEDVGEDGFACTGIMSYGGKLGSINVDGEFEPVNIFSAQKLSSISGFGPTYSEDYFSNPSVVEGSISISAGKAVSNVDIYTGGPID